MSAQALKTAFLFSSANLPDANAFNLHILRQVAHGSTGFMNPMDGHIYQAVVYGDAIIASKSASYDSGQAHSHSSYADKWERDGHMCQDSGFRWYWDLASVALDFRRLTTIIIGHNQYRNHMKPKDYLMMMEEDDYTKLLAHSQTQELLAEYKAKMSFLKHIKCPSHLIWRKGKEIQAWRKVPVYQVTFAD